MDETLVWLAGPDSEYGQLKRHQLYIGVSLVKLLTMVA
jgi:hypothetical protein